MTVRYTPKGSDIDSYKTKHIKINIDMINILYSIGIAYNTIEGGIYIDYGNRFNLEKFLNS